jgi:hypothetical protein
MRVSSTRMTLLFCIEYLAVVPGHDPGAHEKPDVAVLALDEKRAPSPFRPIRVRSPASGTMGANAALRTGGSVRARSNGVAPVWRTARVDIPIERDTDGV